MSGVPITLNGRQFNAGAENGTEWTAVVTGLGGSPARYVSEGRTQRDGAWKTQSYRQPQAMGIEGMIEVPSMSHIPAVVAELESAVSLDTVPLTLHWPDGDRTRQVHRDGEIQIDTHTDRFVTFAATMVADDPRWYMGGPSTTPGFPSSGFIARSTSLPSTSGGMHFPIAFPFAFTAQITSGDIVITTEHGGWWIMQITASGMLESPSVTTVYPDGTDRRLAWDLDLQAGQYLEIHPDRQLALLQGQASRVPTVRQWPTLEPGQVTVQFRAQNDTTAQLAVFYIPYG